MQTNGMLSLHTNWENKKEFDSVDDVQASSQSTPNWWFTCSEKKTFQRFNILSVSLSKWKND